MRHSIRIDILFIVVASIIAGSSYVWARILTECNNQSGIIRNTRPDCDYAYIKCDGQSSMFCRTSDDCEDNYDCDASEIGASSSGSTSSSSSITTTVLPSTTVDGGFDVRAACRRTVTGKYRYPGNCNYYYYCIDGFLVVEQCPLNVSFNEQTGTCSDRITNVTDCKLR